MTPIENCLIKLNLDGILCINKNHTVEKIFIYEAKVFELYYTKSNLQLTTGDLNFMHREKTGKIFLKMLVEAPQW